MTTSLLTIGTEITTGETLNSNSQWMSGRLEALGHPVTHHMAVPDDFTLIHQALDFLSPSSMIFVTGGLGPTQDDLTREAMARWVGVDLEFSEEAWTALQKRAHAKKITVRAGHRHQCHFPKTCERLKNEVGSAEGFLILKGSLKIFVLPGPPKELYDMWLKQVEPRIGRGHLSPWVKWVFKDLRESEVAERFETILSKYSNPKNLEIGYRASPPLIHVKMRKDFVPQGFEDAVAEEFDYNLIQHG